MTRILALLTRFMYDANVVADVVADVVGNVPYKIFRGETAIETFWRVNRNSTVALVASSKIRRLKMNKKVMLFAILALAISATGFVSAEETKAPAATATPAVSAPATPAATPAAAPVKMKKMKKAKKAKVAK